MRIIRIGTRESRLAVIQAELLAAYIRTQCQGMEPQLVKMKTTGDKILHQTLDKAGGKGLFVKELDTALREGRSDVSVHSLKDIPMEVPPDLPLLGFSRREDARDVLVLPRGVTQLNPALPLGCSSPRRTLQLKRLYSGMEVKSIRGNVLTRLEKLDRGEYAGLVLAAAGLKRLSLEDRITRYFEPEEMIPAAGQGILAVQGRAGEDYSWLEGFFQEESTLCALAERSFVTALQGGCSSPIGAYGELAGEGAQSRMVLKGLYAGEAGSPMGVGQISAKVCSHKDAEALGKKLAEQLLQGQSPVCESKTPAKQEEALHLAEGKVWLVGAGPSDVGLLTIKGKEVLEQAQVVVYDRLVGDSILQLIPEQAEAIDVGKRAGNHTMPQEEINLLLLEKALAGKRVVRLKGGDPFLFGRGGEELELLRANDIDFEVVCGVTSAISVPAYNGIPVTHRDYASSVHIITGHKKQGEPLELDFEALVRIGGTLVFLMGLSSLSEICAGLQAGGMDPKMPAAILQQGTTAGQKKIIATLATLEQETRRQGIETPAILVVGRVCALGEKFAWFEQKPLFGTRILATRPRARIGTLSGKLRALGAEVVELPAIRTVPVPDNQRFREEMEHMREYQYLAFTSPAGVEVFLEAWKKAGKDIRDIGNARLAAIGKGTQRALEEHGLVCSLRPKIQDGEHLGILLGSVVKDGDRVLIPRASKGNPRLLEEIWKRSKASVTDLPIYDTVYENSADLKQRQSELEQGRISMAVFTSASTVKGFARALEGMDFSKVQAVCIGTQTKAAAEKFGMKTAVAAEPDLDSLVRCCVETKNTMDNQKISDEIKNIQRKEEES